MKHTQQYHNSEQYTLHTICLNEPFTPMFIWPSLKYTDSDVISLKNENAQFDR